MSTQSQRTSQHNDSTMDGRDGDDGSSHGDHRAGHVAAALQVPLFAEILVEADNYNDSHRYMMQYMLKHGVVAKKNFYLAFIRYYVCEILDRRKSVIPNIVVDEEGVDDLTSRLIDSANQEIADLGFRLVQQTRESDGKQYVVAVSERPHSKPLTDISGFSQDESFLLSTFIAEFLSNDGVFAQDWATSKGQDLPNKMSHTKVESLLDRLTKRKWIRESGGFYTMEPRMISELDPLLRTYYRAAVCMLCQKIILGKKSAVDCGKCDDSMHKLCWDRLASVCQNDEVECPSGCGGRLSKHAVEDIIARNLVAQPDGRNGRQAAGGNKASTQSSSRAVNRKRGPDDDGDNQNQQREHDSDDMTNDAAGTSSQRAGKHPRPSVKEEQAAVEGRNERAAKQKKSHALTQMVVRQAATRVFSPPRSQPVRRMTYAPSDDDESEERSSNPMDTS